MKLEIRKPGNGDIVATMDYFDRYTSDEDIQEFYEENGLKLNNDKYFIMIDGCMYGGDYTLKEIAEYLEIVNRYSCCADYERLHEASILEDTALMDEFWDFEDLLKAVCCGEYYLEYLFEASNFDEIEDEVIDYMYGCLSVPDIVCSLIGEKGISERDVVKASIESGKYWKVDYEAGIAWMPIYGYGN